MIRKDAKEKHHLNAGQIVDAVILQLPPPVKPIGGFFSGRTALMRIAQNIKKKTEGPKRWKIPNSFAEFVIPDELKILPDGMGTQFLFHDSGRHISS